MASVINTDHFRGTAADSQGTIGNSGGSVEDILKRLGILESAVADIRVDIGAMKALLPHLATKADLESVRLEVQSVRLEVQSVRTEVATVRGEISALEASMIKWIIGTVITATALAFSIAKFIH